MPHNQVLPSHARDRTARLTDSSSTGVRKRRRGISTAIAAGANAPAGDTVAITADRRKKRRSILQGLLSRPFATNVGGKGGPGAKKAYK